MKFFEWRHVGLCGRPVWSAGWQFVTFTFKCLPAGRLTARPWDWTGESRRETPVWPAQPGKSCHSLPTSLRMSCRKLY